MTTQANTTARLAPTTTPALDDVPQVANVVQFATVWGQGGGGGGGGGGGEVTVGDAPPVTPAPGALWWDSLGGQLYVWYNDGNSSQWVIANNSASPPVDLSGYLPLTGGALSGPLTLSGLPTANAHAADKAYVDTGDAALQAGINLLASNLLFVGSIDVPGDDGNYTAASGIPAGALPAPAAANANFYVIVSAGGSPPAGAIPAGAYALGDWIVSTGAQWLQLPNGQAALTAADIAVAPAVGALGANVQTGLEWLDANHLPLTGGTLTGPLAIDGAAGTVRSVAGQTGGSPRWSMALGDATAESGANLGSNFNITRYDDAGAPLGTPVLTIARSTGNAVFSNFLTVNGQFRVNSFLDVVGGNIGCSGNISGGGLISSSTITAAGISNLNGGIQINSATNRNVVGTSGVGLNLTRWAIVLGSNAPEAGGNAGSDFIISSFDDAGVLLSSPLAIERATGQATFSMPILETSDAALKENVATVEGALDIISQLEGVYYTPKGRSQRHVGLIAQDVQGALPEVVFETPGTPPSDDNPGTPPVLGVAYGRLVAVLVEAVKELSAKVTALEARP